MIPVPPAWAGIVPWRLVGWAALVAVVALAGWRVSAWREAYKALPAAQEALQLEIECGEGSECLKRSLAAQAKAEAAAAVTVKGYEDELEALRNRPARVRTVRLCNETDSGGLRVPASSGGTGQGSASAGVVHSGDGPHRDIGADLYGLAARADELSAQCRAIIARDRALAKRPD